MLGKQLAIPKAPRQAEGVRALAEVPLQRLPLPRRQRPRTTGPLALPQSVKAALLKSLDPALHSAPVLAEQLGHLPAALPRRDQQQAMQSVVVPGFLGTLNFLLDGDAHHVGVGNLKFSHCGDSHGLVADSITSIMRHYLWRYV